MNTTGEDPMKTTTWESMPDPRKNAWLDRLLAKKMARRRVRYYQEPVFLLDE